jgi:tetratricopeptide (TPR) repeat protein
VGFPKLAEGVVTGVNVIRPTFLLTGDAVFREAMERLSVPTFGDSIGYYQLKADLYRAQGKHAPERSYLDSARTLLEQQVRRRPEEPTFHARLGLIHAYLGRHADAIREGEAAVQQLPVSREAYKGTGLLLSLAMIEAITGRPEAAIDRLEYLLSIPSPISRRLLQADPVWAPLRAQPRFQAMVAGKGTS